MMETTAASTPVVATTTGRVLKDISTSDLNISSRRGKNENSDCKGLIKRMSSEKKAAISAATLEASSSGTYSMLFPPGPMGLHLEPVHGDVGAKVKGYHFSSSYNGISCVVIKSKVKEGDIITLIDNIDATQMNFKKVYNLLVAKMSSNKLVTFRHSICDHTVEQNMQAEKSPDSATSPKQAVNDNVTPPDIPCQDGSTDVVTPLKTLFPVRYDEFSHVLLSVGAHIASLGGTLGTNLEQGMISVGASFEDKTVQVLGKTAQHVPRYSQQDMDFVESKMCAILQELSQTCIQLGKSEDQVKSIQQQLRSVKRHNNGDNNEIVKLRETNAILTSRVERILHDLASEQANRDAWMARARAAEEESRSAWEKCFADNASRDTESDASKKQLEAHVEQIVSLQEALHTANCEAEEAMQLCASEQENMQSELALMRQEQMDRRAETSTILARLNTEKLRLEQERDSLSIELEVLRDTSGADKASLNVERNRVNEAMTIQQNLHMEKLMEKEDLVHQLKNECASLKKELGTSKQETSSLKHDISRMEVNQKATLNQLAAAKDSQLELETKHNTLSTEHTKLLNDNEKNEVELLKLKEVEMLLIQKTHDCESYYKKYENEHAHSVNLEEQLKVLRAQLSSAHSANISSDSSYAALQREYDQLKMSSESAARLATEHVNRIRRRCEARERELVDALTTADHDLVLAKREAAQQKESFSKEIASYAQRELEMEAQVEQSKEAYASLSKSKHSSETIASQQTSHLQAELSRLLQEVSALQQDKLQNESALVDLEKKCSSMSAEKINGVHVTLSKQLNNQVVALKEELSTMAHNLQTKSAALDETLVKLNDSERLNQELRSVASQTKSMQTEYEEKLVAQQCLYTDLKEKLAMDYDEKILQMKSDMQNDVDAKSLFLQKAIEDKTKDEARWRNQFYAKEKELLELQSNFDLLEASSNSSARVAAEQIDRLRARAEGREKELLEMMKEVSASQGQDRDGEVVAAEDTLEASSRQLVKSLQLEVQTLTEEMSRLRRVHLEESGEQEKELLGARKALIDQQQQLARVESQLQAEKSKQEEFRVIIHELKKNAATELEKHEEKLRAVNDNASKTVLSLEEQLASLICEHEIERDQLSVAERGLRHTCEEYLTQIRDLHRDKKASAVKYETLLSDANAMQNTIQNIEKKEKENKVIAIQQQASAADSALEIESRYMEQISDHVREHERLKLLLVESTSNFAALSEKYNTVVSSKREEVSNVKNSFVTQLSSVKQECGNLRLELHALKDCYEQAKQDFVDTAQTYSQTVQRLEYGHQTKIKTLESKCQALVETLEQQQQLIESANQQQKEATLNRSSLLSLVEDWRAKTSEAMHTIMHMQLAESALKVAFGQEKDASRGARQALLEKEAEVAQLWELVDRLADEVKKTTNKSEHLVKSIDSWNSVHDSMLQLHVEPMESSSSSPETSLVSSSLERKERIYSDISKMFPTSPENRSSRYKHVNMPKLLVDSLDSSCSSIFGSCSETGGHDTTDAAVETVVSSYCASSSTRIQTITEQCSASSSSSSEHLTYSRAGSGIQRPNEKEDMDAVRMSADEGAQLFSGRDEDEEAEVDEHNSYFDFEQDKEGGDEEEEGTGDVSGHIIGLHDYPLDETAYWCLSSDTED